LSRPDYGMLDRTLHRIALGPGFVGEAAFDLQRALLPDSKLPQVTQPVFIAGLARSGSTVLLNTLYETGTFRSLTYRDMPFVMMPGIWHSLSRYSQVESQHRERAHGDRLTVAYDSPEAFEEVFWRTFCVGEYVHDNEVRPHRPDADVRRKYIRFVQHVLASSPESTQARYLAKNNNNLLRLKTLNQAFPDAHILVPYRDPAQHAMSLLRQHKLFCSTHREDRFGMQYMEWLGHWEFGLAHKNYAFSQQANPYTPDDVNYWLRCWLDAYTFALDTAPAESIFLSYELLCSKPATILADLFSRLGIAYETDTLTGMYQAAETRDVDGFEPGLLASCRALQERLLAR
jgi:LPS sulfotransferase NodH